MKPRTASLAVALLLMMGPMLSASAHAQSVVGWGFNSFGQTNPPPGLTDVVAVAAGGTGTVTQLTNSPAGYDLSPHW